MRNKYVFGAHFSEREFRSILKCFCLDISALACAEMVTCSRQCVQRVYTLLRECIIALALEEAKPFTGEVEIDEAYFGPSRVRGKRGRGAAGKIPVIGLHKRGDKVFVSIVENCTKAQLVPVIQGQVLSGSDVYTDGWRAYDGLVTNGFNHYRVHHHENEFARGKSHVNGIESFWSYAKFRMIKLRGVRKEKFLIHLKECEWRWNHRNEDLYLLMLSNVRSNAI